MPKGIYVRGEDVFVRFNRYVLTSPEVDGCWEWTGAKNEDGYGMFRMDGRTRRSHQVGYSLWIGEIPPGKEIDHLCRNRACVRPDHMEAVSHQENVSRGDAWKHLAERQLAKTHCPSGHEYSDQNTRRGKSRQCRVCDRERARMRRAAAS